MFKFSFWAVKALAALKALAPLTETKVDDEAVDLIEAIQEDPTIAAWLDSIVGDGTVAVPRSIEPPAEVKAALEARKINWASLLTKLPAIISMAQQFAVLFGK